MDSTDRDRAVDRFVAGLDVDDEELATAVAARAVDATIVIEALLLGLQDDSPVVRIRSAKRVGRLIELPSRLEARLRQLAVSDADRRVRDGADAALHAHGKSLDGSRDPAQVATRRGSRVPAEVAAGRVSASRLGFPLLWFKPRITRGRPAVRGPQERRVILTFFARDRAEIPAMRVQLIAEGGALHLELIRVPEAYVGCRLAVVAHDAATGSTREMAVATEPVDDAGFASMPITPGIGTDEAIARALSTSELEFVVVDE